MLTICSAVLTVEFLSGDFLQPSYFDSSKDRVIRGLETYFKARRADSHAVYYRDALMASEDKGIDESLVNAKQIEFENVEAHLKQVLRNSEIYFECLFTGNVSAKLAKEFYKSATTAISQHQTNTDSEEKNNIPSGALERRINPGEDVELHFSSKNSSEENGAVICSYQSSIPSYKGVGISHPDALKSTAAIRLISHMLREPLFDDLRTKQQLGYVVSAYYEVGFSSRPKDEIASLGPLTVPVDFITVAILSRKLAPPDIVKRIDEFMGTFRDSLVNMPESEIRDHADALSTKLLKPIQKLQTEASNHFAKIQRYSPELFRKDGSSGQDPTEELPWNSVQSLAAALKELKRQNLIETWDRMTKPDTRSRIVSCVYGSTFPLESSLARITKSKSKWSAPAAPIKVINSFSDLVGLRQNFPIFNDQMSRQRLPCRGGPFFGAWLGRIQSQPLLWTKVGIGAFIGASIVSLSFVCRNQQPRRPAIKR